MKPAQPIIFLILIATITPELLSGNTPVSAFFHPFTAIMFILGYGVVILLIREFAVRNKLSYGGIFILGFAYAILNEGLFGKTMIVSKLPISQYDTYGYFLGIGWTWTAAIMLWHAVSSVLFPILATHTLFPSKSDKPWFNKKFTIFSGIVILALGILSFIGDFVIKGTLAQLFILLFLMFVIVILAKIFGRKKITSQVVAPLSAKPIWLGLSVFIFFSVVLTGIAGKKLPLLLFFIVYALGIWLYIHILKTKLWVNRESLFLFVIGCYIQTTLVGMILAFIIPATAIERLVTGLIAEVLFVLLARKIIRVDRIEHNSASANLV